jgi:glutamyl-tRNA(Gln) amidotransferase subunit E
VPVQRLDDGDLLAVLDFVARGTSPRKASRRCSRCRPGTRPWTPRAPSRRRGPSGVSDAEVREGIVDLVERIAHQVEAEGMGSSSAPMGECMGALGGNGRR